MAVILNACKELSRRTLVPGEEGDVPDHLNEEPKWLVDLPGEAQETAHGARASEEVDLLGLEILSFCQEGSHRRFYGVAGKRAAFGSRE